MDIGSSSLAHEAVTSQRTLDEDRARTDIECRVVDYLSHFDGRRKEFSSSIRTHFEGLFSDDMIHLLDGRRWTRTSSGG